MTGALTDTEYLTTLLGPTLTATLLTTPEHRSRARAVFQLIADRDGPDVARAWLIGITPQLDDTNPLHAIQAGHGIAVEKAARDYLRN